MSTPDTSGGFIELTEARQCDCLLDVLRTELNGDEIDGRELELIGLAGDLASRLFDRFWNSSRPLSAFGRAADDLGICGAAGKLRAATRAMRDTAAAATHATEGGQRKALADHAGWLQYLASDVAGELVGLIEQAMTESAIEPPHPRVEESGRLVGVPAASRSVRPDVSSMDRSGSSLAAAPCG